VVPVKLNVRCERRLPESVEVAAYYVVSEGLNNAAKHGHASRVEVDLHAEGESLSLAIHDDGMGGADPGGGSGLTGLKDRVEALGGRLEVASPPGRGTRLDVAIPLVNDASIGSAFESLSPV
jgi:signal transduction histidine kinase